MNPTSKAIRIILPILVFVAIVVLWDIVTKSFHIPSYVVPNPFAVVSSALNNLPTLYRGVITTFISAVVGFGMSIIVGITVAIIMSQSKWLELSLYPYPILFQTVPIIAVAPLIVVWFGYGQSAIIIISFLISLFPIIANTNIGLTSTPSGLIELFQVTNASRLQTLFKLRFPAALPYIVTALKISSGLSVLGAIVGEMEAGMGGAHGGLGYIIVLASTQLEIPLLFAAIICSAIMGIFLFSVISGFGQWLLSPWHESAHEGGRL